MIGALTLALVVVSAPPSDHVAPPSDDVAPPSDDGAPPSDVTLVVFSRHAPRALAVDGERCRARSLAREPGVARLVVDEGDAVRACDADGACARAARVTVACDGPLTLTLASQEPRALGAQIDVTARAGALRVVARVPLEDYTAGVVASELAHDEPAALGALSVVARTYAERARVAPRHDDAMLCDLTHCQVMRTTAARAAAREAAHRTAGRVLTTREGAVAPVFHHAACGGATVDARALWPDAAHGPIVGVVDHDASGTPYCAASPHARWRSELGDVDAARVISREIGRPLDAPSLSLAPRDDDGFAFVVGDSAGEHTLSGAQLVRAIGRAHGWSTLKSQRFVVERAGRTLVFRGEGFGHRVGLCQEGARARARAGASTDEILRAYFPRLVVRARAAASKEAVR